MNALGPRRKPDPNRPGTVYRTRLRFELGRRDGASSGRGPVREPVPEAATPPEHPGVGVPASTDLPEAFPPAAADPAPAYPAGAADPTQVYLPAGADPTQAYLPAADPTRAYPAAADPTRVYPPTVPGGPGRAPAPSGGGRGYPQANDRHPQVPPGPGGSGRSAPPGPAAPRTRRRRPRRRTVVLMIVAVLVLVLVVYPLALFNAAWSHLGRVDALSRSTLNDTPGTNYLVVGSDSRTDLTAAERKALHTGTAVGQRTDTIMLLHVPSGSGPTVLMSIPRDSYVKIPGHGKSKINASYSWGGPELLVATVEQATGVRIDSYVETGFAGFADVVDAVGGVRVCVPRVMKDKKAHLNVHAGCQTFTGPTALAYARARYSDPRGDLGRVERQRQVLAAIASKALSPGVVLQPWEAFPAADAGGAALTVDKGASPMTLLHFLQAMRTVAGGGGLSLTVPVANADLHTTAGTAVEWDDTKAQQLFTDLRKDDTEAIRPLAEEEKRQTSTASGN